MKPGRRWLATDRIARIALASMTLAISVPCWADEGGAGDPAVAAEAATAAPGTTAEVPAPDAPAPRAGHHLPARRLTVAQSIEESVSRLTRGLDLDASQQENLRQILVDQHRRLMKLRSANSGAPADVTSTMLAIYGQTKARIRAMLNDEQKKKYSVDVPRDDLGPAQADLKHWMDLQDAKRTQSQGEGNAK